MISGTEHDRIEALLPWYANGTLDTDEHREIARHLEGCAACREELAFLGDVRAVLRVSAARDEAPPVIRNADVSSLPAELRERVLRDSRPALRTRHWFPAIAAGFMAAVGLGVALTVAWLDAPRYQTATSGTLAGEERVQIAVTFTPEASLRELNALLRDHDAVVVRAPDDSDRWLLEFPVQQEEAEPLLIRLRKTPGINTASATTGGTDTE